MNAAAATRFARQLALPEVGPEGQERTCAARVAVVGDGLAAEIGGALPRGRRRRHAAARGRRRLVGAARVPSRRSRSSIGRPGAGADVDRSRSEAVDVVRAGFDDDPMLRAAIRLGVPAGALRAPTTSRRASSRSASTDPARTPRSTSCAGRGVSPAGPRAPSGRRAGGERGAARAARVGASRRARARATCASRSTAGTIAQDIPGRPSASRAEARAPR